MGFLDRRKASRESKEQARQQVERERAVEQAASEARRLHDALEAAALPFAETRVDGVVLKRGEVAHVIVDGAAFVEPKRDPGRWQGGSQGVSIRVAKGMSYRVGASRGTYQQGEERPTPTDTGKFVLTNQRCVFVGSKRTTEWAFSKLMGFSLEGEGLALFNVSNRQRTTGVFYGPDHETGLDAMIAAAIAKFSGDEAYAQLLDEMEADYRAAYARWDGLNTPAPVPTQLPPPVT
jgi:hypothetical protein